MKYEGIQIKITVFDSYVKTMEEEEDDWGGGMGLHGSLNNKDDKPGTSDTYMNGQNLY